MKEILLVFWVIAICYIWFQTDAFIEYTRFFKKILKHDEYFAQRKNFGEISYPNFLLFKNNHYLIRLICCPICVISWLNILAVLIFKLSFLSLGVMIVGSWYGYFKLVKVIKKLNE